MLAAQFRAWRAAGQKVEFIACETLAAGLAECRAQRPDVVLLDLSLHDSDAENTAASVDLFEGEPPPAVVILTGNERPSTIDSCFRHGADSYLNKFMVGKMDYLFMAVLNASLRRQHRPFYARGR